MAVTGALDRLLAGPSAPPGAVVGMAGPEGRRIRAGGVCTPGGGPVTERTRFDLASVTKVVATTCALHRLAVLGELELTDRLSRYLPGARPGDPTLSDLLHHRAGLWEWQPLYLAGTEPLAALDGLPLRYPPGQGRHYSDLGFILLGEVIGAVTGQGLRHAVAELVAGPLGLDSIGFGPVDAEVAAGGVGDRVEATMVRSGEPYPVLFADPSFEWRDGLTVGEANDGNAFHAFAGVAGHAGLFGAADDLLTLALSLADPAADELWGGDLRDAIFRDGPDAGQASGWRTEPVARGGRVGRMLWHPGFTGCALGFVPEFGIAVVMLSSRLLAARPAATADLWHSVVETVGLAVVGQEGW